MKSGETLLSPKVERKKNQQEWNTRMTSAGRGCCCSTHGLHVVCNGPRDPGRLSNICHERSEAQRQHPASTRYSQSGLDLRRRGGNTRSISLSLSRALAACNSGLIDTYRLWISLGLIIAPVAYALWLRRLDAPSPLPSASSYAGLRCPIPEDEWSSRSQRSPFCGTAQSNY